MAAEQEQKFLLTVFNKENIAVKINLELDKEQILARLRDIIIGKYRHYLPPSKPDAYFFVDITYVDDDDTTITLCDDEDLLTAINETKKTNSEKLLLQVNFIEKPFIPLASKTEPLSVTTIDKSSVSQSVDALIDSVKSEISERITTPKARTVILKPERLIGEIKSFDGQPGSSKFIDDPIKKKRKFDFTQKLPVDDYSLPNDQKKVKSNRRTVPCIFFNKFNNCKFGRACDYLHVCKKCNSMAHGANFCHI